ncbi:LexA family protein [Streptomyces sp. NPDC055299]
MSGARLRAESTSRASRSSCRSVPGAPPIASSPRRRTTPPRPVSCAASCNACPFGSPPTPTGQRSPAGPRPPAWRSSSRPGHRTSPGLGDGRLPLRQFDSQRWIIRALRDLTVEAGYPLSMREIADAVALSASMVAYHVRALERRGVVTRAPRRSRLYQVW